MALYKSTYLLTYLESRDSKMLQLWRGTGGNSNFRVTFAYLVYW